MADKGDPPATATADNPPPPRNQPRRWGRAKHHAKPYAKDKTTTATTSQSISSMRATTALAIPTSVERARALQSFQPIFIDTTYLQHLTHLICEQIYNADPRINMIEEDLQYSSKLLCFYQLARCDLQIGHVYQQLSDVSMYIENLEVPNAIADYIEAIGPYKMMNGVNVIPSVASFVHPLWTTGSLIDDESYALWHTISPQFLPEDYPEHASATTCWRILPSILSRYRMCVNRLTKKTPCRKISNILAGRASVICTTSGSMYAREIFTPEESVVADVRKSSLMNFHLREDFEFVPENNRRLLRPWFYAGHADVSAVLRDSLA